jgi:AhpD family alkylhydroperoxidase
MDTVSTHPTAPTERTTTMTRIPLDPPRTRTYRLAEWYARRTYGVVPDPLPAMAHNPRVLLTDLGFETSLARWKQLDPTLKSLAVMASAVAIGCSWCVDFGYWETTSRGIDPVKMRDVPRWRDSDVYTDLERQVMAYAEAVTATPPAVTDDMVAGLRRQLDDAQLVELTMMVAVENIRSRFNSALGLTSQGFKDRCEIPAAASAATAS